MEFVVIFLPAFVKLTNWQVDNLFIVLKFSNAVKVKHAWIPSMIDAFFSDRFLNNRVLLKVGRESCWFWIWFYF